MLAITTTRSSVSRHLKPHKSDIGDGVLEILENAYITMAKVKGMNIGAFVETGLDVDYRPLLHEEKGFQACS